MCGIIGYVGNKNALDVVMNGLTHLEYRGYDSAGIAMLHQGKSTLIEKAVGKLIKLKEKIDPSIIDATTGMGHTRWATHGEPNLSNAHPHRYGKVTLIHNGIIENHKTIKQKLVDKGHEFRSATDSEVAAHLLDVLLEDNSPLKALAMLCDTMLGAYSLGIMIDDESDRIYFAKCGAPLIVAKNNAGCFFASDQPALVGHVSEYYSLNDHEIGFIDASNIHVSDLRGKEKILTFRPLSAKKENTEKNGHKHFMHKEIFEQPSTVGRVLDGRLDHKGIHYQQFGIDFEKIKRANKIELIGCGSAHYAALLARPFLESSLRIPVFVELASEYRYRQTLTDDKTVVIAVSQSGETADTLAALEKAREKGAMCMAVCNVEGSAIARLCENDLGVLYLNAGPELSVASTKAFVAQVVALKIFTYAIKKTKNTLSNTEEMELYGQFQALKIGIENILERDLEIRSLAEVLLKEPRMFFLGRGELFPVALEGALKMKELTYICAEGYPAGELKHGPIATVERGMPIIMLIANNLVGMKTASNLQEVKARGAKIISVAQLSVANVKEESDFFVGLPHCEESLVPLIATIPLQLLAYHLSDLKGIDVDKPRNLAKSVTVE